jgi:hypothetical protein
VTNAVAYFANPTAIENIKLWVKYLAVANIQTRYIYYLSHTNTNKKIRLLKMLVGDKRASLFCRSSQKTIIRKDVKYLKVRNGPAYLG